MIEGLLGSVDAERVLLFLIARDEGFGREIARCWETHVSGIQRQLDRLEHAGILRQKKMGTIRLYTWNRRWPFLAELQQLLRKALTFLPEDDQERLQITRERPRRRQKPL